MMVLWYGARLVIAGQLSAGQLSAFVVYAIYVSANAGEGGRKGGAKLGLAAGVWPAMPMHHTATQPTTPRRLSGSHGFACLSNKSLSRPCRDADGRVFQRHSGKHPSAASPAGPSAWDMPQKQLVAFRQLACCRRWLQALGASERVFQLLDRQPLLDLAGGKQRPVGVPEGGELRLQGVWFAYPSRPAVWVLQGLSLHVAPGNKVRGGCLGCLESLAVVLAAAAVWFQHPVPLPPPAGGPGGAQRRRQVHRGGPDRALL